MSLQALPSALTNWLQACAKRHLAVALVVATLWMPADMFAQGIFLTGIGPVNQAMGGAAVGAPLDAAGALAWNSASISGLTTSEMELGLGLVLPTINIASQGFGLAGSTPGEPGVSPVPTMAVVVKDDCSPWTWGVGVYGVGGFASNYPASAAGPNANPILLPQPLGLGRIYSQAEIYQVTPTLACALTDHLSVGAAPNINLAHVQADPLFLASPNFALNQVTYGPGDGSRYVWGIGFQVGAYYTTDADWRFGLSYKSNQWFEALRFYSNDQTGAPVYKEANLDLPAIVGLGASYVGIERWLYAVDVRWFDYANAAGFRGTGLQPDGSIAGLGWKGVVSVSNGLQWEVTDCWKLRFGYTFVDSPIPASLTQFNLGSTLFMQHFLSIGGSYQIRDNFTAHVAYTHGLRAAETGPIILPTGPVAGSSITATTSADFLTAGCTVQF